MGKKIIFAIILFLVLVIGLFGWFILSREKPEIETPYEEKVEEPEIEAPPEEEVKKLEIEENCLGEHSVLCYAIVESDLSFCDLLVAQNFLFKDECLRKSSYTIAFRNNDASECDKGGSDFDAVCRALILNENECNQLDEDKRNICRNIALGDCSKIADEETQESCTEMRNLKRAIEAENPALCEQILSIKGKMLCRVAVSKDKEACMESLIPFCEEREAGTG